MGQLKHKLKAMLLDTGATAVKKPTQRDYSSDMALRERIKGMFDAPVSSFCKNRATFDYRHGLVYKLLRTDSRRLINSTLVAHDAAFWLRNYKKVVPALWVVRLAGPETGTVARNQLLTWLKNHDRIQELEVVHAWTRKWGFKDTDYTPAIVTRPRTVAEARQVYRDTKMGSATSRRVLGNTLLGEVAATGDPAEVMAFFQSLNKDVVTFQTIFGAMVKNTKLRVHRDALWQMVQRQVAANNMKIDDKLQQTYERVIRLPIEPTAP